MQKQDLKLFWVFMAFAGQLHSMNSSVPMPSKVFQVSTHSVAAVTVAAATSISPLATASISVLSQSSRISTSLLPIMQQHTANGYIQQTSNQGLADSEGTAVGGRADRDRRNDILERFKTFTAKEIIKLARSNISNWLMMRCDNKSRQCNICTAKFCGKKFFLRHIEDYIKAYNLTNFESKKRARKMHQCAVCGMQYQHKGAFEAHVRSHGKDFGNCPKLCGAIKQSHGPFFEHKKECTYNFSKDTVLKKCADCSIEIPEDKMEFHKKEHAAIKRRLLAKRKLQSISAKNDNADKNFLNNPRTVKRSKNGDSSNDSIADSDFTSPSISVSLQMHEALTQSTAMVAAAAVAPSSICADHSNVPTSNLNDNHFEIEVAQSSQAPLVDDIEVPVLDLILPATPSPLMETDGNSGHLGVPLSPKIPHFDESNSEQRSSVSKSMQLKKRVVARPFSSIRKIKNAEYGDFSGIRHYKCSTCGKMFSRKCDCNKHIKIHIKRNVPAYVEQNEGNVQEYVNGRSGHLNLGLVAQTIEFNNASQPWVSAAIAAATTLVNSRLTSVPTDQASTVQTPSDDYVACQAEAVDSAPAWPSQVVTTPVNDFPASPMIQNGIDSTMAVSMSDASAMSSAPQTPIVFTAPWTPASMGPFTLDNDVLTSPATHLVTTLQPSASSNDRGTGRLIDNYALGIAAHNGTNLNNDGIFSCCQCKKSFATEGEIFVHVVEAHG